MCGIAGRFDPNQLRPDPVWRARTDLLLQHRGPDGGGHFQDKHCELVHRRLAIIDLTPTGDQPMPNEDGTVQVVFNGEIYNHLELRKDLEGRGHRFRGTSDTEVLAHLYEEEGVSLAARLRGMFAFAIYDRRLRSLLLGRDRYGIKPLYYALVGDQLVFASEIKSILACSGFKPRLDRQACYDFLSLGYVPEPATGFVGLGVLPKGSTLLANSVGLRPATFATLSGEPRDSLTLQEAVDEVEVALLRAVTYQSRANVPVAALLSGGIDSSLVVAALCRATSGTPSTFNVRFPESGYDETEMAVAVARHYATRHRTIDIDDTVLAPDSVLALLRHFDHPFADSSLLPTFAVCRAIRDSGIVCTVSGDGGDEAFGGYASFWRLPLVLLLGRLPGPMRILLRQGGEILESWTSDLGRQIARILRLAEAGRKAPSSLFAGFYSYLSETQKEELVLPEARAGMLPVDRVFGSDVAGRLADLERVSQLLTEAIFADSLPADMLRKVDMMSMRASIEVRVPMLDEDVVRCGLQLPHRLKTDGRKGKLVLRALAGRWLPEKVAAHRKQGFAIPLDRMVGPSFHSMLAEFLRSERARTRRFLNVELVDRWLEWFRAAGQGRRIGGISRGGLYQRVLIVLALEVWLRDQGLEW
jgi:asparagine synthase (glutamine-hydrolysing)